jgi:hypothetical protein
MQALLVVGEGEEEGGGMEEGRGGREGGKKEGGPSERDFIRASKRADAAIGFRMGKKLSLKKTTSSLQKKNKITRHGKARQSKGKLKV